MAIRWLITAAENDYSGEGANIWHADQNEAAGDGDGFTEAEDVACMNANSGNLTLTVAMACQSMQTTGYTGTLALGANALDVNGGQLSFGGTITGSGGISVLDSITFVAGTDLSGWTGVLTSDGVGGLENPTLTTNAVTIPALTINNDGIGSFTLADNLTVGPLTYTAGKFTTTGRTITLRAGTHNVDWWSLYPLAHLIMPDGAKAQLTGGVTFSEITIGNGVGGSSVAGANVMEFYCAGDDKWDQTAASGAVAPSCIRMLVSGANRAIGYLDASACTLAYGLDIRAADASRTVTQTDDWTTGALDLILQGAAAGRHMTLDTATHALTAGDVLLGINAATNASGILDLGTGSHGLATISSQNAANTANAIDFATCTLTLSGTLDGADIACTNTGALIIGGKVQNVNAVGNVPLLRRLPGADTGNTNVICPSWRRRIRKAQRAA